jgi:AhpD family alkylhydroperoxidase
MTQRIQTSNGIPAAFKALLAMTEEVVRAATGAGVEATVLDLIKIRASQVNACAFCLDMHVTDALKVGEDPRRINLLPAWRETELYSEQERAALELTETLTRLSDTRDVPDDVYEYATKVFTESQYQAVVWMVMVINSFNRIVLPGRPNLPRRAA